MRLEQPRRGALDALAASLGEAFAHPLRSLRDLGRAAGLADSRALSERLLRELAAREERAYQRVCDYFYAERAATLELQWLVRRAFCRGLGEPGLDERFAPAGARDRGRDEGLRYRPLEARPAAAVRLARSTQARSPLRIESELGDSAPGAAVPRRAARGGAVSRAGRRSCCSRRSRRSTSRSTPCFQRPLRPERAGGARWCGAGSSTPTTSSPRSRRATTAPPPSAAKRPQAARELEEYLTGEGRPPLLRATISLRRRRRPTRRSSRSAVERLRARVRPVTLHRPLGDQLRPVLLAPPRPGTPGAATTTTTCWSSSSGRWCRSPPTPSAREAGPYIGHTLSGSRQPVLFDLTEASRTSRAAGDAAGRDARLGQDAAACSCSPTRPSSGRLAVVRHRPQGRPPARSAARRGRADGGDRAVRRRALPRAARPAADRAGRTRARTWPRPSSSTSCPSRCRPSGGPRSAAAVKTVVARGGRGRPRRALRPGRRGARARQRRGPRRRAGARGARRLGPRAARLRRRRAREPPSGRPSAS